LFLSGCVKGREADFAGGKSGGDDQDVEPFFKVFNAEGIEETADGEFRGGIASAPGESHVPGNGDDASQGAFAFEEPREGVFGTVDGTPEVDIHEAAEDLEVDLFEEGAHGDPRVVDKHVDAAESGDGFFHQLPAILFAGDVSRHAEDLSVAQFCRKLFSRSTLRAAMTTWAPSAANFRAKASPIPEEAPVMTTTFPFIKKRFLQN